MPFSAFTHVTQWVFDLDNTLYPPEIRLFDQIETRMTNWVMDELGVDKQEADRLRQHYWETHGTTLAGLMREHDINPDGYLHDVHDISFAQLPEDPQLAHHIAALPGRRIVYTNGTKPYAQNVLNARGLGDVFHAVYGVEHADFHPKPDEIAFKTVFNRDGIIPQSAAMFEDDPRNLRVPHELGMQTIHVAPTPAKEPHIHHHTSNLTNFLAQVIDSLALR